MINLTFFCQILHIFFGLWWLKRFFITFVLKKQRELVAPVKELLASKIEKTAFLSELKSRNDSASKHLEEEISSDLKLAKEQAVEEKNIEESVNLAWPKVAEIEPLETKSLLKLIKAWSDK